MRASLARPCGRLRRVWITGAFATVAFVTDGERAGSVSALADRTDFVAAWRRVDGLDSPPATRGRAFALWVGLFDVADDNGSVRLTTNHLLARFEIARNSLFDYRSLLEDAGVLVHERNETDKRTTLIRLTPPLRATFS